MLRAASPAACEKLEERRMLAFGPLDDPFQVNTYTTLNQINPAIAAQPNGDFILAWESSGQDGSGYGIYAQRYNAAGTKLGEEFRVNTYTTGNQRNSAVAVDDLGNFVIAWQSVAQVEPNDTSGYGVYARRYTVSGEVVTAGEDFLVNTITTGNQRDPSVAMDSDGDFVIAWRSPDGSGDGIFARRYDNTGAAIDAEDVAVNTATTNTQLTPVVAMDGDGDFVVAWKSYNQAGATTDFDIYARRFVAGVGEPAEVLVNVHTTGAQGNPTVAMNSLGDYVIAWDSQSQDGDGYGVYARRFNSAGAAQGDPFLVNAFTTDHQILPTVSIDETGKFVVAWASRLEDESLYGIYARRYDSAGAPLDLHSPVNTYTTASQLFPAVAMDADGDFVVAWHGGDNQDGSGYGVFARRYGPQSTSDAPQITAGEFIWQTAPQRIEFVFDMDVSASIDSGDLVLTNLTTSTDIPAANIAFQWNAATSTLRYTFPSLPNGGALPNGHYRATIVGSGVNAGGSPMAQDYVLNFFFVNGDADHSGAVDVNDLGILASNWQQSVGMTYQTGDFDYSGTVDVNDLGILASNWQFNVGPPPSSARASRPETRAPVSNRAAEIVESTRAPARR